MYKLITIKKLFFWILLAGILNSCGGFKYSDARKNPTNADERIQKNMETGKGLDLAVSEKVVGNSCLHLLILCGEQVLIG